MLPGPEGRGQSLSDETGVCLFQVQQSRGHLAPMVALYIGHPSLSVTIVTRGHIIRYCTFPKIGGHGQWWGENQLKKVSEWRLVPGFSPSKYFDGLFLLTNDFTGTDKLTCIQISAIQISDSATAIPLPRCLASCWNYINRQIVFLSLTYLIRHLPLTYYTTYNRPMLFRRPRWVEILLNNL